MRIRPTKYSADFINKLENIIKTNHEILLLSSHDEKPRNPHIRVNTTRVKNTSNAVFAKETTSPPTVILLQTTK